MVSLTSDDSSFEAVDTVGEILFLVSSFFEEDISKATDCDGLSDCIISLILNVAGSCCRLNFLELGS